MSKTTTTPSTYDTALIGQTIPETIQISQLYIDQTKNMRMGGVTPAAIAEMRASLRSTGQIQRILVMPTYSWTAPEVWEGVDPKPEQPPFQVVAGYTRALAALAEFGPEGVINVEFAPDLTPENAQIASALENAKRTNIGPYSEGLMYSRMMEDQKMTQSALAKKLGVNSAVISNRRGLIRPEVQSNPALVEMLDSGAIPARAMLEVLAQHQSRKEKLIAKLVSGEMSGTDALAQISAWRLKENEAADAAKADTGTADENADAAVAGAEAGRRGKSTAKPLTIREIVLFFTDLLPDPDPENPDAPVDWDFAACVADLTLKVLAGKMSAGKFTKEVNALGDAAAAATGTDTAAGKPAGKETAPAESKSKKARRGAGTGPGPVVSPHRELPMDPDGFNALP